MKRYLFYIFLFLSSLFLCSAAVQTSSEYQLKLAFIKQFPMFIEWPIEHQKNMQEHPFRIGIYGENKFKPYSRSIQIKTIKGKPIELINITQVADVKELDILFLSEFKKKDLPEILNHAKESKILTIAEQYGAGKKGVMINFYIENNTVRFELNKTVLDENNFKVSSKLWRMAKIIQ